MPERATYDARLGELADDLDELLKRSDELLRKEWHELRDGSWLLAVDAALKAGAEGDRALAWATQRRGLRAALSNTRKLTASFKRVLEDVAEAEGAFASLLGVSTDGTSSRERIQSELAQVLREKAQAIEQATRRAVLTGDKDLIEQAGRAMGSASQSISLALHEMPMGFSRAQAVAHAEAAGVESFKYFGPRDSANRRFCRERVGNVYSTDEIEGMDNGYGTDVMTHCGGWRCRHHWRASFANVLASGSTEGPGPWDDVIIESVDDFVDVLREDGDPRLMYLAALLEQQRIAIEFLDQPKYEQVVEFFRSGIEATGGSVERFKSYKGFFTAGKIYVNQERSGLILTLIHEGIHGVDWAQVEDGIVSEYTLEEYEVRAYTQEEAFKRRRGWPTRYGSVPELVEVVRRAAKLAYGHDENE